MGAPAAAYPYPYPGAPGMMPAGMPVGGVDLRRGVRIALTVLLSLAMAVLLLLIAARGEQRGALDEILRDGLTSTARDRIDDADGFYAAMVGLYSLVLIATAVLWVIWFRRMRLNAEAFAPGTHRFGSGWAVGSWFTPVVNLWFPKQMANDIYRASAPAGPQSAPKGLLNAWWTLWLTAGGFSIVGSIMFAVAERRLKTRRYVFSSAREDVESLKTALSVSTLALVLYIVAALLALLVVRQLSKLQEQRALAGPLGVPPMGGVPMGGVPAPGMPGMPGMPYGAPAAPPAPAAGWAPVQQQPPMPQQPPGTPYGQPPQGPPPQNPFGNGPQGY
ncbi:DUF4328 domain-containing protein [Streptomyces cinnamoneus]|uniref:DUF4328 domain-containing protein n=1 Tax=Streptomyces cinnamoneus TaxID=53446 RepID=UPI001E51E724|nr:DUF4328 domain-containing protein [Streptomyces cinnamoneus]